MKRFGKPNNNKNNTALGIGALGKELILFYLANHLGHLYATDLYSTKEWEVLHLVIFQIIQAKYSAVSLLIKVL